MDRPTSRQGATSGGGTASGKRRAGRAPCLSRCLERGASPSQLGSRLVA